MDENTDKDKNDDDEGVKKAVGGKNPVYYRIE